MSLVWSTKQVSSDGSDVWSLQTPASFAPQSVFLSSPLLPVGWTSPPSEVVPPHSHTLKPNQIILSLLILFILLKGMIIIIMICGVNRVYGVYGIMSGIYWQGYELICWKCVDFTSDAVHQCGPDQIRLVLILRSTSRFKQASQKWRQLHGAARCGKCNLLRASHTVSHWLIWIP